jgi:DNA-binding response OmpR family regulator
VNKCAGTAVARLFGCQLMSSVERRAPGGPDRRRVPRGGRRPGDRPGKYPPVLIAESYETVRRSCARYLDTFHFDVREATNGEETLSAIAAELPRVILAEVNLPAMPAARLAHWLGQNWRTRNIPLILLAGHVDTAADGSLARLASAVLVKPFTFAAMLSEVRRVIRTTMPSGL